MRIRTETGGDRPLVELVGRFDAHEVPGFRAAVDQLVAVAGSKVRVDLSQVVFIDSSALAELVRAQKTARGRDGDLILGALSDPVRIILELTALLGVFTVESAPGPVVPGV